MVIWGVLGRFCHGLVFFTLSLTVSFLHYRSRRILLARHLFWLGAFAIGETVYAWGHLLALSLPVGSAIPEFVPLLILAITYTCLLAFGFQTLLSEEVYQSKFRAIFLTVFAMWLADTISGRPSPFTSPTATAIGLLPVE